MNAKNEICVVIGLVCGWCAVTIAPEQVVFPYDALIFVVAVFIGWILSMAIFR